MQRASEVRRAGGWNAGEAIDRVVLDADERRRRRIALTGERGTRFLLDLPHATMLCDGDGLVLDNGAMVRVAGRAEPLLEIAAADAHHLARLAWHLGNRHTDVQIVGDRLRMRRDHVLAEMLKGLGARLAEIEAPFDPEPGAYGGHGGHATTTTAVMNMAPRKPRRSPSPRRGEGRGEGAPRLHDSRLTPQPSPPPADGRSRPSSTGYREREQAAASGESAALYRLMTWLSPSYPVGAFAYSSGLEYAVEAGDIRDAAELRQWLTAVIAHGSGGSDAVLFVHAHRAAAAGNDKALQAVAELAAAFVSSRERHLETTAQGRAFVEATRAAWPCEALDRLAAVWDGPVAYPVAVATASAGHGIALEAALPAYLQAVAANLVSAGVRLIPLGQTDGQRVLAALEPVIADAAQRAMATALADIGGATFRADIASMRHETQYTRLFRS